MSKKVKATTFDRAFDAGERIVDRLDLSEARRPGLEAECVKVVFPKWMVQSLDREARRLGVTRQSLMKLWLAERLRDTPECAFVSARRMKK